MMPTPLSLSLSSSPYIPCPFPSPFRSTEKELGLPSHALGGEGVGTHARARETHLHGACGLLLLPWVQPGTTEDRTKNDALAGTGEQTVPPKKSSGPSSLLVHSLWLLSARAPHQGSFKAQCMLTPIADFKLHSKKDPRGPDVGVGVGVRIGNSKHRSTPGWVRSRAQPPPTFTLSLLLLPLPTLLLVLRDSPV